MTYTIDRSSLAARSYQLPVLTRRSQGDSVQFLQEILSKLGKYTGKIDGEFGDETERSVCRFQQTIGIRATGIVEQKTWRAIARLYHFLND